mgnify:CR=1 FL=1
MRFPGYSRREVLELAARSGLALGGAALLAAEVAEPLLALAAPGTDDPLATLIARAPVARWWVSANDPDADCAACHEAPGPRPGPEAGRHAHRGGLVKCQLCAHGCLLREGERGRCRARIVVRGELRSLVYGRPVAEHVDPIEKKPFFHFLPGAEAYSFGTAGCPLRCRFCQNWEISQSAPEDHRATACPPEAMVARARGRGAPVLAFTYNEPTVFAEYLCDTARAARRQGLRPVLVSCGFMNEAPLAEMIEVLDAVKIDLKGFAPAFYRDVAGAELAPVLRSMRQIARAGRHLEIVNLVVPTLNDSDAMLGELVRWVVGELGPDVPVHFTRFHPDYQLQNLPPTPVATLERARERALAGGIRYAYVGNVPGHPGAHTHCPRCGRVAVERNGIFLTALHLKEGACESCGTKIAGVWS